jgi:hypothetical protein
MFIADLDIPAQYLDTQTSHTPPLDEAADAGEAVVDERHASDEDKVARDENQTSQRQVASDQNRGQAVHRQQRRCQPLPRQQEELKTSPDMCGCKGWGGLCRCKHA